jgi:hypothetical protein
VSDLLNQLGRVALLPEDELLALIRSAPHRYKVYQIPKRNPGQSRTIAQPAKEVKALQYWVMSNVLNKFRVHPAATGYRKGRSIAHNARPHARGRFLLKLDFKDFFPSLKARDFRHYLKKNGVDFDKETVEALCRVLFWRPKGTKDLCLSIGAPTSPLLSNILMLEFDRSVSAFCAGQGVAYTRYADDLTFSAKISDPLASVETMVHGLCRRMRHPSLTINEQKTVRVSKGDSRRVTGLVLTNDRQVSLGRDLKRRIRAWVHHFATDRLNQEEVLKLRGMLNYVNSVEPTFIQRLIEKYGTGTIKRIQTVH